MKKIIGAGIFILVLGAGIFWWVGSSSGHEALSQMTSRELALHMTTDMATTYHIHPELKIFVEGVEVSIPKELGVTADGMTSIHTHEDVPIIHIESPVQKDFTLGDFFAVWGKDFSRTKLFDKTVEGTSRIIVTVNGQYVDTYENTILRDKDKIVISYETI